MSVLGSLGRAIAMMDSAYASYGTSGIWTVLYSHFPGNLLPRTRKVNLGFGDIFLRAGTSDKFVFKDVFIRRTYDLTQFQQYPRVKAFYEETLRSGRIPLIVDCGAYSGLSPRFFARQYPLADIIALEPADDNFTFLQKNTARYERIEPRRAAVSDANAAVTIGSPNGALCGYISTNCAPGEAGAIESVSLNHLILGSGPKHVPFIVKIDIEGAERNAFLNSEWFSSVPVLIIEVHDWMFPWEGSSAALLKALSSQSVDMVLSGENLIVFNWSMLIPERARDLMTLATTGNDL